MGRMMYGMDDMAVRQVCRLIWDLNQQDDTIVVVEGKRDAQALRHLGFEGTLMEFHRYGGFAKFADTIKTDRRIIILFDYDRKGSYMTYRLIRLLQRRARIDVSYRRRLARITRGRIRYIEQLISYDVP